MLQRLHQQTSYSSLVNKSDQIQQVFQVYKCSTVPLFAFDCLTRPQTVATQDLIRAPQAILLKAGILIDVKKPRSQEMLAEAELAEWLEHPMEMGYPPKEMKLMAIIHLDGWEEPNSAMYLFKVRHPDWRKGEWFVGVAGPYPLDGPPRIGGRKTFSHFQRLDERSLEEHVEDYALEGTTITRLEILDPPSPPRIRR